MNRPNYSSNSSSASTDSDEDLLERIAAHDSLALQPLLARHNSMLRAVIYNIVRNQEEVDDVMQEVAIQVWERAYQYSRAKGKAIAWLTTLARRRAIDNVRQWALRSRTQEKYEVQSLQEPDSVGNGIDEIYNAEIKAFVAELMQSLPEAQQQVISLCFLHGMSQRQISAQLKAPLGTVKTRLELGLRKLLVQARARNALYNWAQALLN